MTVSKEPQEIEFADFDGVDNVILIRVLVFLLNLDGTILGCYDRILVTEDDRVHVARPLNCLDLPRTLGLDEAVIEELGDDWCHCFDKKLGLFQVRNYFEDGEIRAETGDLQELIPNSNFF